MCCIQVGVEDLEFVDKRLFSSVEWMRDNSVEDVLYESFQIEHDLFGEKQASELKPGGASIPVT